MSMPRECDLSSLRLVLEPIEERHGDLLFDVLQDATIYTFIPTEPPRSRTELRARYLRLMTRHSPDGSEVWLNWAVRLQSPRVYIGTIQATVRADATALIAYELGTAYRGSGYGTEACRAVIAELVDGYGVSGIHAYVDTRNERSIRLLERLGFDQIRHIRDADHFKGSSSDEYEYRLAPPARPPD
jgi:[ribosomal protein S5]-alanine N-acetyltransferase